MMENLKENWIKFRLFWHQIKFIFLISILIGSVIGVYAHNYFVDLRLHDTILTNTIVIDNRPYTLVPIIK